MPANYLLVSLLVLSGCIENRIEYYYLELGGDSLEVESSGQLDKDAILALRIKGHEPMATSYVLSRQAYTIHIDLPTDVTHPVLIFSAEASSGSALMLTGMLDDACAALFQAENLRNPAFTFNPIPDGTSVSEMGLWWHGFGRSCWRGGSFVHQREPIEVTVTDKKGRVLGREKLTYRLLQNGEYWLPDGF